MNAAFLKPAGRTPKNKIDMARNVTSFKVVPATIGKDRVLPAEESTVAKGNSIAINTNRQRLANRTGGILECDILGAEVVCIDKGRGRAKSADRFAVRTGHFGIQVICKNSIRRILADKVEKPLFALDIDQFLIGARFDADDGWVRRCAGRSGVNCGLDGFEFRGAV